ncbi:ribonuclease T2 family protein [Alterinioella nitratireducens]|uniref:ribonuclease T2 family protein n=1 Tax=Alterinioella nitratireducens TaxID=2735915 RepID=UPI001552F980|nr:ribonuclease T2 [Alterinioella nitratireducens]NPD19891.1 ribonuclease T2 [Alterinioella nitratireducens]
MIRLIMALMLIAGAARAEGERAGAFDYYVLALSWTPTWCAIEGDGRGSPQCDPRQGFGFTLHGLWPQYEAGWPSYCPTSERNPSRGMTADMADIMGSSGLAWHQWNKHGVCSGLSARDYFALSRLAYERVTRPDLLRNLGREVRLPAEVIEEAFLEENPDLRDETTTVTCRDGRVQEIRICLTRDLDPRECGRDVARDCSLQEAIFAPMR